MQKKISETIQSFNKEELCNSWVKNSFALQSTSIHGALSMCVEEGRTWLWVQGSSSSLGHLQYGMLREDKADGGSPLLCETHTLPSPISRHKSVGPSCVTKMKQAQTTLSEPGTTAASPSWGDRYSKCVSFLRLWNIHRSAQEVAIHRLSALCSAAGTTRLAEYRIKWWGWGSHLCIFSKCCRAFAAFV